MNLPKPISKKDDAGKLRPSLLQWAAIRVVAAVATWGANEYTPDGWLNVPDGARRYREALARHNVDYLSGVKFDAKTKFPVLAHIAWNSLALLVLEGYADSMGEDELRKLAAEPLERKQAR